MKKNKKLYGIHKIYEECNGECGEDFVMNMLWEDEVDAINQVYKDALEYLTELNDQPYDSIEDAEEKQQDEDFRIDVDGDYTAIIRWWDGDNYEIVAIFNVEEFDLMGKGVII